MMSPRRPRGFASRTAPRRGSGFAGPSPERGASTRPLPGADVNDVESSTRLRSRPRRMRGGFSARGAGCA